MGDTAPSRGLREDDDDNDDDDDDNDNDNVEKDKCEKKLKNGHESNNVELSEIIKPMTADSNEIPEVFLNAATQSSDNAKNNVKILKNQGSDFIRRRKPVFLTFRARHRPRQPFMNQGINQNPAPPPRPPSYYTSGVSPEQHRPEVIRLASERRNSTQREPTRREEPLTTQPRPSQQNRDVTSSNMPRYQPGGHFMMSNPFFFNFSYWAPYPKDVPPNVLPCLAHLYQADSLFIIQQVNILELMFWGYLELPNFYLIQNKEGQIIYYVYETTNLCLNSCCGDSRGFQLHVMDMYNNEVIYLNRPCGCTNFACCYPVMEVYSPPLVPVGAIMQVCNPRKIEFSIIDSDENLIFKIYGPLCFNFCCCCLEVDFTIHAPDKHETEVGVIRREWGGFVRTFIAESDMYGITFPKDLDVRIKAVFLGALFFISLKRTGWVLRNVEDPETVSGHMYRMSVMTFLIPETVGVNKTRCMKLSLVHDLAECIVGDLTPFCGVDASEKHRQEDAAMKELTQMIGDSGAEIYKLYKEYEAQVTDESKFVKDLDRLDMILQAFEYEKVEDKPGKLEEFFASTLSKFHFPWTIDIVREIYKQRNLHIKKDNV